MTALVANRKQLRALLPLLSLAIVLAATFYAQPRAMSYFGLNLMLQYAVPIALATIAQLFVITVNDLDLSIGPFVGLVGCIGATYLNETPLLGIAGAHLMHRRLCRHGRPDPSAQPAFDRGDARRLLHLARHRGPHPALARRQGAGLAQSDHVAASAARSLSDHCRARHRGRSSMSVS